MRPLLGVRDRDVDAVDRFDDVAAQHLDQALAGFTAGRPKTRSSSLSAGTHTSVTSCTDTPPRFGFTSTRSNGSFDSIPFRGDRLEVGSRSVACSSVKLLR